MYFTYDSLLRDEPKPGETEGETIELTEEKEKKFQEIDALTRVTFDEDTKTLNYKQNSKVILPGPLDPTSEAGLAVRKAKYLEVTREFTRSHCKDSGDQKATNRSKSQIRGIQSLEKRVREVATSSSCQLIKKEA